MAESQRLVRELKPGNPLGKSKLKPVEVAPLPATWAVNLGRAFDARLTEQHAGQYPAKPKARAGVSTLKHQVRQRGCYRTCGDGRKMHFQARQKWNPRAISSSGTLEVAEHGYLGLRPISRSHRHGARNSRLIAHSDPIHSPAMTAMPSACFHGGAVEMPMVSSMLPKTSANSST